MIEFFRSWVLNIVIIIILIVITEIIIPSDKFKKYVKFVTGLILMMIIINPIVEITNKNYSLDALAIQSFNNFDKSELETKSKNVGNLQNNQILKIYKEKLKKQVIDEISSIKRIDDVSVDLKIDEDTKSKTFGSILEMNLSINKIDEKNNNGLSTVSKVLVEKQNDGVNVSDKKIIEDIKNKLINLYELKKEQVSITVQKSGR